MSIQFAVRFVTSAEVQEIRQDVGNTWGIPASATIDNGRWAAFFWQNQPPDIWADYDQSENLSAGDRWFGRLGSFPGWPERLGRTWGLGGEIPGDPREMEVGLMDRELREGGWGISPRSSWEEWVRRQTLHLQRNITKVETRQSK